MKVLKFILFLILIVVIGGSIYFATKDGAYDISESKQIQAPVGLVFDTVNEYKTWSEWGPWKKEEPDMKFTYGDQTNGVGGNYAWDGNIPGDMITTALEANKNIYQDLHLVTPGGDRYPKVYWTFEPSENGGTTVTWGMKGEHPFMDKMYYAFSGMDFNAEMKDMHTKGLDGLETFVEAEMNTFEIKNEGVTEHGGGFYLYKTSSASSANISAVMEQSYGEIMSFASQNNIAPTGMPFTIYNEMLDNGGVVMSNAIPVKEKINIAGNTNILCGYMPKSKVAKTTLRGNYTHLGAAWAEAIKYVEQYNLEESTQHPFEIYTNDPGQYPNPAEWLTEIYIPIK